MAKGQHKVRFVAKVPEVAVKFRTKDGDLVQFDATKKEPQVVSFFARNKR